jgi:hypothetical protein
LDPESDVLEERFVYHLSGADRILVEIQDFD